MMGTLGTDPLPGLSTLRPGLGSTDRDLEEALAGLRSALAAGQAAESVFRGVHRELVLGRALKRDESVIAVELLPGDSLVQSEPLRDKQVYAVFDQPEVSVGSFGAQANPGAPANAGLAFIATAGNAVVSDPLGRQLGDITSRRILRCSPLTPVAPPC